MLYCDETEREVSGKELSGLQRKKAVFHDLSHYDDRENNSIELKVLLILNLSSYRCLIPFQWQ